MAGGRGDNNAAHYRKLDLECTFEDWPSLPAAPGAVSPLQAGACSPADPSSIRYGRLPPGLKALNMSWKLKQAPTQNGRIAIVTGANIGLGY